ncbi:hypothetical protein SAMN05421831_10624 [Allopseudospirillum japonicum]|uniref:Uncharacterized protein n=1 Tax=Allopseudospirillum japonicum TaxID=64971 RepID=A0A1H6S642_9GAMM|nr:hypothetical protein SAMN05421831_10624 [Allopseudospirillum japonicum]
MQKTPIQINIAPSNYARYVLVISWGMALPLLILLSYYLLSHLGGPALIAVILGSVLWGFWSYQDYQKTQSLHCLILFAEPTPRLQWADTQVQAARLVPLWLGRSYIRFQVKPLHSRQAFACSLYADQMTATDWHRLKLELRYTKS